MTINKQIVAIISINKMLLKLNDKMLGKLPFPSHQTACKQTQQRQHKTTLKYSVIIYK